MGCDADVEVAGFVAELLFSVTDNTSLPRREEIVGLQLTVRVAILGLELRREYRTCLPAWLSDSGGNQGGACDEKFSSIPQLPPLHPILLLRDQNSSFFRVFDDAHRYLILLGSQCGEYLGFVLSFGFRYQYCYQGHVSQEQERSP
jgi:hypothetical protein